MNIELNLVQSIALIAIVVVLGEAARRRVGFLNRFCIPGPVVGPCLSR